MREIHVKTANDYAGIFWPEFVEKDGCVYLQREWQVNLHNPEKPSESEWDMNHTHIIDIVKHHLWIEEEPWLDEHHPDWAVACELGLTMSRMWAAKLLLDFPRDDFRVYFHGFDPIVRFHKVRDGVPNAVEHQDWFDGIRDGSVVIIDTRTLRQQIEAPEDIDAGASNPQGRQ